MFYISVSLIRVELNKVIINRNTTVILDISVLVVVAESSGLKNTDI